MPQVDPFKIYPLDPVSEEYVNRVLRAVPGYNEGSSFLVLSLFFMFFSTLVFTPYAVYHHSSYHSYCSMCMCMCAYVCVCQWWNIGAQVRLDFADSLLRFAPEHNLDHLHNTPLLVVHGEKNELHPVAEPISLLAKYPGTCTHQDNNPKYQFIFIFFIQLMPFILNTNLWLITYIFYHKGHTDVYWVPQGGHTEWMLDDNEKFQDVVRNVDAWVKGLHDE